MSPEKLIIAAMEPIAQIRDKVYPVEALKKASAPFAFFVPMEDAAEDALDGPTELATWAGTVHVVTGTYAELLDLVPRVRAGIRALRGRRIEDIYVEYATIRGTSPDLKEREVALYRRALDVRIHFQQVEED